MPLIWRLIFLFILIWQSVLFSQDVNIQFDQITTDQGLSNNRINAILKDSKGFMWFGTADGLNRYDGVTFKIYKYDPDDSTSISGNFILSLCEDRKGNIWVGTFGDGLNRFDRNTGKFTRFDLNGQSLDFDQKSSDFNNIFSIYEDPYEPEIVLWLITTYGTTRFFVDRISSISSPESTKIAAKKIFKNYDKHIYNALRSGFCCVAADSVILWLGTGHGLTKFNKTSETAVRIYKDKARRGSDFMINKIYKDEEGYLWLATERDGLNKFDPTTGKYLSYKIKPDDSHNNVSNIVHDIHEDDSGKLWLLTPGSGYYQFNKKTEKFICYKKPQLNNRIGYAYWGCSYLDDAGIHWLGSKNDGIFKYVPLKEKIQLYNLSSKAADAVDVRAFYKDKKDSLWVSSVEALYKFDTKTGLFSKTKYDPKHANKLFQHSISVFNEDKNGILWLGTEGGGLKRYNFASGQVTVFYNYSSLDLPNTYFEWDNYIWSLTEDLDGNFFIRSYGGAYNYLFNKKNLQYLVLPGKVGATFTSLFIDHSGNYFAGSRGRGLYHLEKYYTILEKYLHNPNDQTSISNNFTKTIFEDKSNHLWIGTAAGLNLFDRKTRKFTSFLAKDGLASDNILSILEDDHGNLWLATPRGITRFTVNKSDPSGKPQIKNYGIPKPVTLYASGVCYKDEAGNMYFGGKNGFIGFHPDHITENKRIPPIVITGFKLFNEPAKPDTTGQSPLSKSISDTREIVLSHDQNFFSFEFAALDYTDPKKNHYAYKMEGIDQDWIYTDARQRTANYTDVRPGEYVFHVKGSNNDGVWNESGTSVAVTVLAPWWQSTLAYSIYFVVFILLIYLAREYELRRLRLKHAMEMKHNQLESLRQVDRMKSRFFANISHEFRTPLTLIQGPIDKWLPKIKDSEMYKDFEMTRCNSNRLLRLINQLLDLSKLESGSVRLQARCDDIVVLLRGLVQSFESLAREKNIDIQFKSEESTIFIYFDRDKIEQIFINLLSNAFKFTPEGGEISLHVSVAIQSEYRKTFKDKKSSPIVLGEGGPDLSGTGGVIDKINSYPSPNPFPNIIGKGSNKHNGDNSQFPIPNSNFVEIKITNTGPGIPLDKIDKIFNRFYQTSQNKLSGFEGSGIGLSLTRELVELHKGTIEVSSEPHKETEFRVRFLLGKDHLRRDEITELQETLSENVSKPDYGFNEIALLNTQSPRQMYTADLQQLANGTHVIMLVEDNPDMRSYIRGIMEPDYQILEADNGRDGFKKAVETMPDIIVSDVMMPEMNGFQFCEKIKTDIHTSHIPVILLTAKSSGESKVEGLETGADDYLTKPFDARELYVRVKNLIEQRKKLSERFSREIKLEPKDISITSADERFLNSIMNIIENNISNSDFNVANLVNEIGLSRMQLYRKIHSLTNQSAIEFIRTIRLKRAAKLLENRSGNISEIAYEAGFNNPAYFSACFKKQFGILPSEYMLTEK